MDDLEVIYDFYKEGEATAEDLEERYTKSIDLIEGLEFKNMLSEEGDNLSAVLQITAGAGRTHWNRNASWFTMQ